MPLKLPPPSNRPKMHVSPPRLPAPGAGETVDPRAVIRRRVPSPAERVARASLVQAQILRRHLAHASLTVSEEDKAALAGFAEESSTAHVLTDAYGKILDGNAAASALLRVDEATLPSRRLLNYVVRDSRPQFYATMAQLRESCGTVKDLHLVIRPLKSGPLVPTVLSALGKRDARGQLVAVHWFVRRKT